VFYKNHGKRLFTRSKAVLLVFGTYIVCFAMALPILVSKSDVFACKASLQINRLMDTIKSKTVN